METGTPPTPLANGVRHSLRVLRPLMWWSILVLALYGIRTHQQWMERTRLNFSVTLAGRDFGAGATLDGKPVMSGESISLGRHTFAITDPKIESFSTNLFIWYGGRDF